MRGGLLEGVAVSSHTQGAPSETLVMNFSRVLPTTCGGPGWRKWELDTWWGREWGASRLIAPKSALELESFWPFVCTPFFSPTHLCTARPGR